MIHDLKPYPTYKDSGVPWLGKVPEHWEVKRLKAAVAQINDQTSGKKSEEVYVALEHVESWTGRVRLPTNNIIFDSQVKRFHRDDVLFGKLRPYLAKVARLSVEGVCVGEFLVLRPRSSDILSPFLENILRSKSVIHVINSSTFGAKMPRADWGFIGNLLLCFPPRSEQSAIIHYLDHMDRRIRRYIRAKQKLIKLLEEQKQAIIHQAVTRGLDPDVKLKPSGVKWIGEIPSHWEIKRLKRVIVGKLKYGANESAELEDQELPRYIRITDFSKDGKLKDDTFKSLPIELAKDYFLNQGDVLFARSGATVGKTFQFKNYSKKACFAGYLIKASPDEKEILSDYFYLYTKSNSYEQWKNSVFIQATIQNISADKYQSLELTVPPLSEQQLIVNYLSCETQKINALIYKTNCQLNKLREFRTRLIADVVTGKLDVRDAAANLPEETDETEVSEEALAGYEETTEEDLDSESEGIEA